MSDTPEINGFPAAKLGTFLRAMEDPEGTTGVEAGREREIAGIEERLVDAARRSAEGDCSAEEPPRPSAT